MKQHPINTGEFAFDPSADNLKEAMEKTQDNFTQLFDEMLEVRGMAKPPVILKVTHTLPCRPDKGGLYLLKRIQTDKGWMQYKERYRFHVGQTGKRSYFMKIATSPTTYEPAIYSTHSRYVRGLPWFRLITEHFEIDPVHPFFFIVNTLKNTNVVIRGYNENDVDICDLDGHSKYLHWKDGKDRLGAMPDGSTMLRAVIEVQPLDNDTKVEITQCQVRQYFELPDEFGVCPLVLMKYTGSEWITVRVPQGVRIPVKGNYQEFVDGELRIVPPHFPKLLSVRKSAIDPSDQYHGIMSFKFDSEITNDYAFIFSRPTYAKTNYPGGENYKTYPVAYKRFVSKSFKKYNELDQNHYSYEGYYRGYTRITQEMLVSCQNYLIKDNFYLSLNKVLHDFFDFEPGYNGYVPLVTRIRNYPDVNRKICYYIMGFELAKKIKGKWIHGESYKIRFTFWTQDRGSGSFIFRLWK